MNITVIGTGYVGLVTGTCFAELGNHVTCVDVNVDKINRLREGEMPIYEPGLEELVKSNAAAGRLYFTTSLNETIAKPQVIFIAVGTPSDKDGAADIKYVLEAARDIGKNINDYCVIVDKSTVPVGMADQVREVVQQALDKRNVQTTFDVVSNPEFLREGAAIDDFMQPDRVIVGLASERAKTVMLDLYLPILPHPERLYFMNIKDAEMTKYAANAMLATRISFMNEMAVLCEKMGVDIENVRIGIGSDARIGSKFLNAGCGYGGSCFPKDVRALMKMAEINGVDSHILYAVEKRNFEQKRLLFAKLNDAFAGDVEGLTVGVWGLAFKPGTDDMREAPSMVFIEDIVTRGGQVRVYDPAAMDVARELLPPDWLASGKVVLCASQYEVAKEADALVLVTEWKPFRYPDLAMLKNLMRRYVVIDGRNQYDPQALTDAGFTYYGIGRVVKTAKSSDCDKAHLA